MKNFLVIGLLAILFCFNIHKAFAAPLKTGDKIPEFKGKTLDGKFFDSADYKGKYLLIDIGSAMCIPCQETLKQFQKLHSKYAKENLVVLSINMDGDIFKKNLDDFVKQNKLTFPILIDDAKKSISKKFSADTIPYILFVNPERKVLYKTEGEEIDIAVKFEFDKYFSKKETEQTANSNTNQKNIIARIGNETITMDEFDNEIQALPAQYKRYFSDKPLEFLKHIIDQKIVFSEAHKNGYAEKKEIINAIEKAKQDIIVNAFIRDKMKASASQEEMQNNYKIFVDSLKENYVIQINEKNLKKFEPKIDRIKLPDSLKTGLPTLIDLGSGTCMPCKKMEPILKELKEELKGKAEIRFIDVNMESTLASSFPVEVIPTQFFFSKDGIEIDRHEGYLSKEEIMERLKKTELK